MPVPQGLGDHHYQQPRRLEGGRRLQDGMALEKLPGVETGFENELATRSESRRELIARIKRDQRPPWLSGTGEDAAHGDINKSHSDDPSTQLAIQTTRDRMAPPPADSSLLGSGIERPRSALHAGDFREQRDFHTQPTEPTRPDHRQHYISTSPPAPWSMRPAYTARPATPPRSHVSAYGRPIPAQVRSRATSHSSLSSSFMYRPPTSPLAVLTNSGDIESDMTRRASSRSPDKSSRRRTFSPGALMDLRSQLSNRNMVAHPPAPLLRREETFPQQAHQPRRSISSLHSFSSPQAPYGRSRRASLISEGSPLSGAPMVGGYEESILRGRMSTYPSKPLDFVASIGVLGKGDCKSSLRCPAHISVPFPAVFYDYGSPRTATRGVDTGPSPYVGLVDLENRPSSLEGGGLHVDPCSPPAVSRRKNGGDDNPPMSSVSRAKTSAASESHRRKSKSTSSRSGPQGSYRIPQQGQLQVVIKSPNKTAVKLFLVPYDLEGMQPGQKTFIRQRSYSAGPIIDMPLSSRRNLGTDRPEAAITNSEDPRDRPVLRYLIHLHICCPSHGKFYLYKSMRVVFANRVPDGKEKLRHETQLPQPRFIPYKPGVSSTHIGSGVPPTGRPRGFSLTNDSEVSALFNANAYTTPRNRPVGDTYMFPPKAPTLSIPEPSPFAARSYASDRMLLDDLDEALSPGASKQKSPVQFLGSSSFAHESHFDFKRAPPVSPEVQSDGSPSPRDSLLAMQLRGLANEEKR